MKSISSSKQIKLGAVISYFTIAFNIISGLVYTPWMINSIGKDHYALYTVALSIINIFLLDFGIGSAVSRFLAKFYAEGQQEKANVFMGIVYKIFFAISAIIALVLAVFYFCIDGVYKKFTPTELTIFKHLFIIVSIYSVVSFPCTTFKGILMANEKFIAVKLCGLGQKVFDVALIIVFLLLGYGVYAMVLVHALSNLVFCAVRYAIIKKTTKQKSFLKAWEPEQAKGLFNYSIWITINSLAQRCIFNIMPTIIAAVVGSVEVTLFSLASTLEGYVYVFANAINGMFLPKISRILVTDNYSEKLNSLMIKVGKYHVFTLGLIILGFICLGSKFVILWMGSGAEKIYICAVLLMIPSLFDIPQQVARTSLLALNIVKEQALIYVIMGIINVALSLVLVPLFGAIGAAISIFIAYSFRTFAFNILYVKRLPIRLGKYFKEAYKGFAIPAIVVLALGYALSVIFPVVSWANFIVSGCILILVYALMYLIFGFDKQTVAKYVNGFKNKILK